MACELCKAAGLPTTRCAFEGRFVDNANCGTLLRLWSVLGECVSHDHPRVRQGTTRYAGGALAAQILWYVVDLMGSAPGNPELLIVLRELADRKLSARITVLAVSMTSSFPPDGALVRNILGYLARTKETD